MPYSIGIDLGGTNLRAAAIDAEGRVLEKMRGTTDLHLGRDAVIDDIVTSIRQLQATHGDGLAGVGVGVPGFIDMERGYVLNSNNLPEIENFPIRAEISRRLGTPVILENDANAAALGEKWLGAGQAVKDLVLLTLGTGVGGGIISEGRILHGFMGMAGELGHMTIYPNGNPCGCGNYGCLEKHASATAIVAMAHMLSLGDNLTAVEVYEMAKAGNEKAKMVFHTFGAALGIAVGNLVNIFNFPLYLLSGGVLAGWDMFAPSMLAEVERRSFTYRSTRPRIEPAILGGEAGLFGAAFLPFQANGG